MDDRKKLTELLEQCSCAYPPPCTSECSECNKVEMYDEEIANIAYHLIANGVTFAKDTNVPSKTDAIMEEMYDFYQKTVAHAGPSKVDYIDGVYALMDHMARWLEEKESEEHA